MEASVLSVPAVDLDALSSHRRSPVVDTDMVGPFGHSAVISGTWPIGDVEPGSYQGGPDSKLEERCLVTDEGPKRLSTHLFEVVLPA